MLDLIKELEDKNIKISLKDNNLQVNYDGEIDTQLLSKLKENKEKLIQFLTKHSNIDKGIKRIDIAEDYPVSHAQKRIWIRSQSEDNSKAYHIYNQIELKGNYDICHLEAAVYGLIDRHESLRTIFKLNKDEEIRQSILSIEELNFKVALFDFRNEKDPYARIDKYIKEDNSKKFDLEKGPLFRVAFIQLSDDECIFYFNMHHIITDGWSINILERDFLVYYEAIKSGFSNQLEPLNIQYKDYASWQKSAIKNGDYSKHREYWMNLLREDIPKLDLPSTSARPKIMTYNGNVLQTFLSVDLTHKIKDFSWQNGGSIFMVVLTILKILLHKYTSQSNIVIGTAVAGREDSDLEDQIGFYVNTLVLQNKIDKNSNFFDFFKKVKDSSLEAFSHQIYPFDMLVEDLNLARDFSRNPIFDVMYIFHNQNVFDKDKELELDTDIIDTIKDLGPTNSNFDLDFEFKEVGNALSFKTTFNADIYDKEMISALMIHFKELTLRLLDNPNHSIKEVNFLTTLEKKQILIEFNSTKTDYPKDKTVIDLFEEQVDYIPENIALVFEDRELTFKVLNERANQLGHFLREKYSIQSDDLIGVKLDRSEKMIIAILGVLKSGAAYVPIDTKYPKERVDYIVNDTKCKVVIDEIEFEKFYKQSQQYPNTNLNKINYSSDLAYIIYTSGTTGDPKGVMIEHLSLSARLNYFKDQYNLSPNDKILFYRSFCFDGAIEEYILPFVSGSKCVIASKNFLQNLISNIIFYVDKYKITKLNTPPALLEEIIAFCDNENIGKMSSLKHIVSGGDKLKFDIIEDYLSKFNIKLYNTYGPTENTIDSTNWVITSESFNSRVLIGKPIQNSESYILDEGLRPVPIGVFGKLYVSGVGVARGYLNKSELTNQKFIENPFIPKTRMFDTGDVCRWLSDGNIEFYGRSDYQVKIRGYRIELGEIETVLFKYSQTIKQVVVEVKELNGDKELVAYYTSKEVIDKVQLRVYLQTKLPEYMVPSFYIELKNIPMTQNGKIDREALTNITSEDTIRREYVAPRNETEQKLVDIWQAILGVQKIGIMDNFFEIGGNSLKAAVVMLHIKKQLNIEIEIKNIFLDPTIGALAEEIDNLIWLNETPSQNNSNLNKITI